MADVRELVREIQGDCSDRRLWSERQTRNRELRYRKVAMAKPMYKDAPNLAEPVIDDTIRDVRCNEMNALWNAKHLANFIALDAPSKVLAGKAEEAFDFYLRMRRRGGIRKVLSTAIDTKLERGMAILGVIEGADGEPDVTLVDPLNLIVPTDTKDLSEAERVCHVQLISRETFLEWSERFGFDAEAVEAVLAELQEKEAGSQGGASSHASDRELAAPMGKEGLPSRSNKIEIWEIWSKEEGERWRTVVCPEHPERALLRTAWAWVPRLIPLFGVNPLTGQPGIVGYGVEEMEERPWPFVQFRVEDTVGFYNTRGVPELCEADQQEASAFRTLRGIVTDFAGKPLIRGVAKEANFKFKPGEKVPEQMSFEYPNPPTQIFSYNLSMAQSAAARRLGSAAGGAMSSDARKDNKTAREVTIQANIVGQVMGDSIDRFGESLGALFELCWQMICRKVEADGEVPGWFVSRNGAVDPRLFSGQYLIASGTTGRAANITERLGTVDMVANLMKNLPGLAQFIRVEEVGRYALNLLDPVLAETAILDVNAPGAAGQPPVLTQIGQLGQQVQGLAQYLKPLGAAVQEMIENDQQNQGMALPSPQG